MSLQSFAAEQCDDGSVQPDPEGRVGRRRAATRARLLRAAQELISSGEAVTVAAIVARADIALASFYTHFATKEDLLDELVARTTGDLAGRFHRLPDDADPAVALAGAVRQFWAWFTEDPIRGRYVLEAARASRTLAGTLGLALATLIEHGRRTGRFRIASTAAAAYMIGGGLMGATQGQVTNRLGSNIDVELATQALQLLGLPPDDAATAARDSD
ncbi:TetR/AcrR family transcriptional regulator [Mycobacterium sp.]|uniref:TetR/AcrR family transcriptional regulator n=1 Tax=Mycobacterium sp. TaxID=1785 RepID=UPI003D0A2906